MAVRDEFNDALAGYRRAVQVFAAASNAYTRSRTQPATERSQLKRASGPDAPETRGRGQLGGPAELTARQREVAALIAAGATNAEIARVLVISPGTAANHVANVMDRLGLDRRAQIAVWAVQHGLVDPEAVTNHSTATSGV